MKKILKWLILIIPILLLLLFVILHPIISNTKKEEKKAKNKEYVTKDNRVTFTAGEDYVKEDKGDYDLYLNKKGQQIVGAFTYTLSEYNENTSKMILDKQIQYYLNTRKDMKLFKKESKIEMEDKTITKVEYSGKTDKSSDCIYIFSVIDFKADTNYTVYVNEVLIKKNYEGKISEMINILKSAKLN